MNETNSIPELARGLGQAGIAPAMPIPMSININQVENGFIVMVGCKQFVSQHIDEVLDGVKLYFTKPDEATKKFLKERK